MFKWANHDLFVYFRPFLITISIIQIKSIDVVVGIRTRGCMMVDADNTTKLWQPPLFYLCLFKRILIVCLKRPKLNKKRSGRAEFFEKLLKSEMKHSDYFKLMT